MKQLLTVCGSLQRTERLCHHQVMPAETQRQSQPESCNGGRRLPAAEPARGAPSRTLLWLGCPGDSDISLRQASLCRATKQLMPTPRGRNCAGIVTALPITAQTDSIRRALKAGRRVKGSVFNFWPLYCCFALCGSRKGASAGTKPRVQTSSHEESAGEFACKTHGTWQQEVMQARTRSRALQESDARKGPTVQFN